ncbi:chromosome segregation ATPase [Xanthomonas arboricola]
MTLLNNNAKARTERVVTVLRKAMSQIELEIEQSDGIYPYNAGRLSQAELCRRAGVANVTLQNPSHKTSTLVEVNKWLKLVRAKMVSGRKSVRRALTDRVENIKQDFQQLATNYNISRLEVADLNLELVLVKAELKEAKQLINELEREISQLRIDLAKGKVVRMPQKRERS